MARIEIKNKELYKIRMLIGVTMFLVSFVFISFPIFLLIGALISFGILASSSGVEINTEQLQYRNYKSFLFRRKGEWKNIPETASIVILSKYGMQTTSGGYGAQEVNRSAQYYELYLMSKNHRTRFYLHSSEDKDEIKSLAVEISKKTNLEIKPYNPI